MTLRKLAAGLGLGALAAAIVLTLAASADLFDRLELTTYDWRMRLAADPRSVNRNIVLVEINNLSIREMSATFGRWPWPRLAISFAIDFLHRAPAKVIAVDISLPENDAVKAYQLDQETWSGSQSDHAMADSVRKAGSVVMLADAVYEGVVGGAKDTTAARWTALPYHAGPLAEPRPVVLAPYQALTDAAAALGHNFATPDDDGQLRRLPPFIRNDGKELPSLGVAAALRAGGYMPSDVAAEGGTLRVGDRRIPLVLNRRPDHDQWTMLINYRAPALVPGPSGLESPYPSYEIRELFAAEQEILQGMKPRIDPAVFKDKIVFIGFTASGLVDVFSTPMSTSQSGTMPGIQMHASMADSILANRFIRPVSTRSRIAAVIITATAIGMLSALLPFGGAAVASMAILGGWTWFTVAAFKQGNWLNLAQPIAVGGLALFFGAAYQYFIEGREKRKVSKLFGRYVSRDVYSQLMANPDQAELGGKRRDMSVLFSDIRGFTTVTERGNPEELVSQLNEYFSRMVEIVFQHKGTVDKFVGDMVMALFGAPLDDPEHAEHAVAAAVHMVRELGGMNRAWAARGMAQLDVGVGVNSGDMIAGNIGSSSIMSYTVIGDNVNLGSRLESLNKEYKTRIIISDATRLRLKGNYEMRPLGDVVVKGKSKAVAIYEIKVEAPLVQEVQTT
ncbi:MAG TPA: adenylate/guanylate cyclase domain-containing protein [Vicinamibacterales bacterium]|jgi:adenylate cyclase|nr:adenylate/guanylate cyclase domain-containing protein [Vicinamibacterales bacterium]